MEISKTQDGSKVTLKITGLPQGIGETYGNFIRRSILLGDNGWDLASVRVNQGEVKSKFDIVEGILEDCLELCFNLKDIEYMNINEASKSVKIEYVGKGNNNQITAGDIFAGQSSIKIMNPELVICNTVGDESIKLELVLTFDKGFVSELNNNVRIKEVVDQSTVKEHIVFSTEHSEIARNCHYNVEDDGKTLNIVLETKTDNYARRVKAIAQKSIENIRDIYISL